MLNHVNAWYIAIIRVKNNPLKNKTCRKLVNFSHFLSFTYSYPSFAKKGRYCHNDKDECGSSHYLEFGYDEWFN